MSTVSMVLLLLLLLSRRLESWIDGRKGEKRIVIEMVVEFENFKEDTIKNQIKVTEKKSM